MEVWEWWPFMVRRARTILWITALTVAVTAGVTFVVPPAYRATAVLDVRPVAHEEVLSYPSASQMVARNLGELVKGPGIASRAAKALGQPQLESTLDFRVPQDTSLVEVTADGPSPERAAGEANAVADALVASNADQAAEAVAAAQKSIAAQLATIRGQIAAKQAQLGSARAKGAAGPVIDGLQDELDGLRAGYQGVLQRSEALPPGQALLGTVVSVSQRAVPDPAPVSPRPVLNIVLGIAGGLLLGLGLARATERPQQESAA